MTITTARSAKNTGRRGPRHRFAQDHAEPADRPTKPATATTKSSQIHPAGVVADHIRAIQQTPQPPPASPPPPLSP